MRRIIFGVTLLGGVLGGLIGAASAQSPQRHHIATPSGLQVGYLLEHQHRIEAYSASGLRLGYYDKRTDKTYDSSGRIIARGNIASSLIPIESKRR